MNQIPKYGIIAFAAIGAFLILSTGFVQPVTIQAASTQLEMLYNTEKLKTSNNLENIGEHLKRLLDLKDQYLIETINEITDLADENKAYNDLLEDLAKYITSKNDFQEFTVLLDDAHKTAFDKLIFPSALDRTNEQTILDTLINDQDSASKKYFSFSIKKHDESNEQTHDESNKRHFKEIFTFRG